MPEAANQDMRLCMGLFATGACIVVLLHERDLTTIRMIAQQTPGERHRVHSEGPFVANGPAPMARLEAAQSEQTLE